jgi:hypothetical protein
MAEALHIDLSTKQKSPGPVLLYVHVCLRSTIKSAYLQSYDNMKKFDLHAELI